MVPVKIDQDWPTGLGDILIRKCGHKDGPTHGWTYDGALLYYKLSAYFQKKKMGKFTSKVITTGCSKAVLRSLWYFLLNVRKCSSYKCFLLTIQDILLSLGSRVATFLGKGCQLCLPSGSFCSRLMYLSAFPFDVENLTWI